MNIGKIAFIEAGERRGPDVQTFTVARVGTVLLATILRERGYEVKTFIEDVAAPDWSFIESADLVCISTLTSTAVRAYSARGSRKGQRDTGCNGRRPLRPFLPEEALQHADFVIRGEGDRSLPAA